MPKSNRGFTLVELLVSIAVLIVLVLLVGRLFSSAATITASGNKRMTADAQLRPLFDRMAVDFSQMIKRSDVDYYLKSSANAEAGNDQLAFYSAVAGYYPSSGSQSPISVVGYRINSISGSTSFNKLERMSKGLVWNGVSTTDTPIVFLPLTISGTWPAATSSAADPQGDYELIAPYVFRFEYYYLLKNGSFSVTPWNTSAGHSSVSGMQDVSAISVCIAAIDPKSRVLISDSQLTTLMGRLPDFAASTTPGGLLNQWQSALDGTTDMPRPAIQGVRIYERYFYLLPKS
jgi:prepilin-type N-terminal cleavage/methylation domain-containing protein